MSSCAHCHRPIPAHRGALSVKQAVVLYCSRPCKRNAGRVRARHRHAATARPAQAALDAAASARIAAFVGWQGAGSFFTASGPDTAHSPTFIANTGKAGDGGPSSRVGAREEGTLILWNLIDRGHRHSQNARIHNSPNDPANGRKTP